MAVTFRSTPAPKKTNIKPGLNGLIEPGAFVEVTNTSKNLTLRGNATFNYDTGRYLPYLWSTTITVEGDLGMLTRAEISFVVETDEDFDKYTSAFLIPNEVIDIRYGWRSPHPGWERAYSTGTLKNMVIYDFSFEYLSDTQQYMCFFKAMAATSTIDEVEFAITIPKEFTDGLKFITESWWGVNSEHEVTSISELILAQAQANEPDPFDDPKQAKVVAINGANNAFIVVVPVRIDSDVEDVYNSVGGSGVRVYVNMDYIINYILNTMVVGYHKKTAAIDISKLKYELQDQINITGVEKLFSPNPLDVVFPGDDISSTYVYNSASSKPVLTFTDTFINGFSKCIDGNILKLGNILISLDALLDIQKQVADIKDQKSKAESTDESARSNILLSINDFIKKISALINKNSGGLIDLVVYHPEDDSGIITIADRNYKNVQTKVEPLILNNRFPGDGVTRTANIKAEVPKDALAMNAYLNNIKGITANKIADDISAKAIAARKERINNWAAIEVQLQKPTTDINNPRASLVANAFNKETIDTVSRQVRQYVQNRPLENVYQYSNSPYPLKLTLSLVGVDGFKFGDLINLKYMPFQYTGKNGVCFRVIRVTHKFNELKWTTDLETVCDLL